MKRRAFLTAAAGAVASRGWPWRRAGAAPAGPGPARLWRAGFVHLHVDSWYSRDGVASPQRIVRKARELGFAAVALTDHGNLFGVLDFHEAARTEGVRPILGCELYVESGSTDTSSGRGRHRSLDHLTVLASDATGYRNLLAIVSSSFEGSRRRPPRVAVDVLASHAAGLIALSGCGSSAVSRLLAGGDAAGAQDVAAGYQEIFGKASYFLELCPRDLDGEASVLAARLGLSRATGAPLVATNDVHYLDPREALAHEVLVRRRSAGALGAPGRERFLSDGLHMRSAEEMLAIFAAIPGACLNTMTIAERCQVTLPLGVPQPPACAMPAGRTPDSHLEVLALEGLRERYGDAAGTVVKGRLVHELAVVRKAGLAGYVLAVRDLLRDARRDGLPLAASRGAAFGSLLLHCLGVTPVDPLRFGLLFEHFLDGGEPARPDLGVEFPEASRDTILRSLIARHGADRVVSLTSFGRLGPWAALERAGRALGQESDVEAIMSVVAECDFALSLDDALRQSARLREHVQSDPRIASLYDAARALEGWPVRPYVSTPVLFLSAPSPDECVPIYRTARRPEAVAACEWRHMPSLGCALDLVGASAPRRLEEAVARIRRACGITVDVAGIPLDDATTYAALSQGRSPNILGLESRLVRRALQALRPDRFEELVALLALCRPGA